MSLVAVMDWFSRFMLSWAVSSMMDVPFGVDALDQALKQGQPEIFHTHQGAQFTSQAFTARLKEGGLMISMAGRGRALNGVFVERLGTKNVGDGPKPNIFCPKMVLTLRYTSEDAGRKSKCQR